MKFKLVSLLFLASFLFTSCNCLFQMDKRNYRQGYYFKNTSANKKCSPPYSFYPVVKESISGFSEAEISFSPDTVPLNMDSIKLITISSKVGPIIDLEEKASYNLFSFWA